MSRTSRREIGDEGEERAARHLESLGFRILERNFRARAGEIDLVARDPDGETLVFVEVRLRGPGSLLSPEESVGPLKKRRVARAAQSYLRKIRGPMPPARFDVVAIDSEGLRHIPDAFDAGGLFSPGS